MTQEPRTTPFSEPEVVGEPPDPYLADAPAAGYPPQGEPAYGATTTQPDSSKDVAKDQASQVGQGAADAGKHVAGVAKGEAANVVGEAKSQAKDVLQQARGEVRGQAGTQQQRAAEGLQAISQELGSMADRSEQQGVATDLARQAADRAGQAASWLQDREPEDLLEDVRAFARRRPGAFLGIALAAGVVAGRLTRGIKAAGDDDAPGGNGSRPLVSGTGTTGQDYRSGGEGLQSPSAYPPAPVGSGDPLLPGETR